MSFWQSRRTLAGVNTQFSPRAKVVVERGLDGGKTVSVIDDYTTKVVASVSKNKEIITFPVCLVYSKGDHVNNKIINRSFGILMDRPKELALSMKQTVWASSRDFTITYNSLVKLNKIIGPVKRNQFLRAILEMIMQCNIEYEHSVSIFGAALQLSSNENSIQQFWAKIESGYSIIKAMVEFAQRGYGAWNGFNISKPILKAMLRAPVEVNCRSKLIRFANQFQAGGLDPSLLSGIPVHSWLMACHATGCPELVRAIILHTKNMTKEEANKSVLGMAQINDAQIAPIDCNPVKEAIQILALGVNEMKHYYERQQRLAIIRNRVQHGRSVIASDIIDNQGIQSGFDLSKSTFTSLKRKVDEWHEMLNHQERDEQLMQYGDPDKKFPIENLKEVKLLVDDLEFEVVILKTPREMVEEGVVQQHCIATYIPEAKACRSIFYGIRKDGKRVASAQVSSSGSVMQIKGYHNGPVLRHLEETFREWVNETPFVQKAQASAAKYVYM